MLFFFFADLIIGTFICHKDGTINQCLEETIARCLFQIVTPTFGIVMLEPVKHNTFDIFYIIVCCKVLEREFSYCVC